MTNADARAALDEAFKARIGRLYHVLASDIGLRSVPGVEVAPPDQAFTRGLRQTRAAYDVAARQIDLYSRPRSRPMSSPLVLNPWPRPRRSPPRVLALELKAWRATRGWSVSRAAEHIGVPTSDLTRWEDGAAVPFPSLVETAIGLPVLRPVRQ